MLVSLISGEVNLDHLVKVISRFLCLRLLFNQEIIYREIL